MTWLDRGDGVRLAYALQPGAQPDAAIPTIVFLPGLRSDMSGDKAVALAAHALARGWPLLRLDYSGHGASDGRFEDGTISRWRDDALLLIDRLLPAGPLLLVGSSMGGWLALLVALARPERVAGLLGIAAAPDFTETLLWTGLDRASRAKLLGDGVIHLDSAYGPPLPVTRALVEDGRRLCLLGAPIPIGCPVRLLHGQRDEEVPWRTALTLAERLASPDVAVTLIKDGGHRLSRPRDLAVFRAVLDQLLADHTLADESLAADASSSSTARSPSR